MAEWKESEHPRDNAGKFIDKEGSSSSYRDEVNERIKWAKENNVELPLNNDGSLNDIRLRELWESAENIQYYYRMKKYLVLWVRSGRIMISCFQMEK